MEFISIGSEMNGSTRQEFLNELCPHLRPLIAQVLDCECACELLDFFRQRPITWLQASDIAYHLRRSESQAIDALDRLIDARLIERKAVLDSWTFYRLGYETEASQALEQFWLLRDDHLARLERAKEELKLRSSGRSSALPV
jgi:predicted transcriptional regulator